MTTANPDPAQRWGPRPSVPQNTAATPSERPWYKSWGLWVFILVQLAFLWWLVGGVGGAASSIEDCTGLSHAVPSNGVLSPFDECEAGSAGAAIGTGLGAALVIGLWVAADFIMGVSYAIYRLAKRK